MAQALQREFVESFVTPKVSDTVFFELRDSLLPENEAPEEYGESHPEGIEFPDHKLVLIAPAGDVDGVKQKWFYAKDRDGQEEYNWEVTYPFNGLPQFPVFTCEFVLLRSAYESIAKGTAHPLDLGEDTKKEYLRFQGAKLVLEQMAHIKSAELKSLYVVVRRTYATVPSIVEQTNHKSEKTFPYAGLKGFPRITRDYVVPRQDFIPLTKGTADPVNENALLIEESQLNIKDQTLDSLYVLVRRMYDEVPSLVEQEVFNAEYSYPYQNADAYKRVTRKYVVKRSEYDSLVQGVTDNIWTEATLVTQIAARFSDAAQDSLYLMVTRVFDHIPDMSDETDAAFLASIGYQISRPHGDDEFPRVTWKFPLEKTLFSPTAEYALCPIVGYEALQLTNETLDDDPEAVTRSMVTRVYDTFPGPETENEKHARPFNVPSKFVRKQTTIKTDQRVDRNQAVGSTGGNPTSELATIESSVGPNGESNVIYRKGGIQVQYELETLSGWAFDQADGKVYPFTQEVVPAGTGGSDITSGSMYSEVTPFHPDFSIKTTRKASGLVDEISYPTIENYSWPAVLRELEFKAAEKKGASGDYVYKYLTHYKIDAAYSGPCDAIVTEGWSRTKPTPPAAVSMQTDVVKWNFILTAGQLPTCLHPAFYVREVVGNTHPMHPYSYGQTYFEATNFTEWPGSIVAGYSVSRQRGGYRYRKVVVDKPTL